MKLLGLLAIVAGLLLSLLVLRLVSGQFADWTALALFAAIANGITGMIAFALIRFRKEETTGYLIGLILGYLAGIGGGAYFHFT